MEIVSDEAAGQTQGLPTLAGESGGGLTSPTLPDGKQAVPSRQPTEKVPSSVDADGTAIESTIQKERTPDSVARKTPAAPDHSPAPDLPTLLSDSAAVSPEPLPADRERPIIPEDPGRPEAGAEIQPSDQGMEKDVEDGLADLHIRSQGATSLGEPVAEGPSLQDGVARPDQGMEEAGRQPQGDANLPEPVSAAEPVVATPQPQERPGKDSGDQQSRNSALPEMEELGNRHSKLGAQALSEGIAGLAVNSEEAGCTNELTPQPGKSGQKRRKSRSLGSGNAPAAMQRQSQTADSPTVEPENPEETPQPPAAGVEQPAQTTLNDNAGTRIGSLLPGSVPMVSDEVQTVSALPSGDPPKVRGAVKQSRVSLKERKANRNVYVAFGSGQGISAKPLVKAKALERHPRPKKSGSPLIAFGSGETTPFKLVNMDQSRKASFPAASPSSKGQSIGEAEASFAFGVAGKETAATELEGQSTADEPLPKTQMAAWQGHRPVNGEHPATGMEDMETDANLSDRREASHQAPTHAPVIAGAVRKGPTFTKRLDARAECTTKNSSPHHDQTEPAEPTPAVAFDQSQARPPSSKQQVLGDPMDWQGPAITQGADNVDDRPPPLQGQLNF
jgi:hypothetical protein